jgi:choice-of-anchor A domain-containing protein
MNKKLLFVAAIMLSVLTSTANATSGNVGTYNLILKNDLSTTSDIEGKLLVGGDINMSGKSLDVGSSLATDASIDAVTVVGNITSNDVKSANGNIVYGGDASSTNLINNGVGTSYQEDSSLLQAEFDAVWDSVLEDSAYFASLDANAEFNANDMNQKYLEASTTATDLVVYDISVDDILSGNILFADTPTVPVVINVDLSGLSSLTLNSKVLINADEIGGLVLWNFYSTDETITDINFSGDGWRGSILAPYANISSSTGALEGGVAALSYTGSVELHNNLYVYETSTESSPTEVPAPAGVFLVGLGLLVMLRRKNS